MKILWISHFLLYPDTGYGALQRSKNLLKCLSDEFELILICLYRNVDEKLVPDIQLAEVDLKKYCKSVYFIPHKINSFIKYLLLLNSIFTKIPYSIYLYRSEVLLKLLKNILDINKIDLIHADTIGLIEPIISNMEGVKTLTHHDIESHKVKRRIANENSYIKKIFFQHESKCLEQYEKKYCNHYDLNVTVSEIDEIILKNIDKNVNTIIIENGVDCEYFAYHSRENSRNELIFAGPMDYYPNVNGIIYFYTEVWPLIKTNYPDLIFTIIGKNPPEHLLNLIKKDSNVNVTGYVQDLRPYIREAKVYICPIREGGGTRLKILDALAQGIPVVSTKIGAEGLNLENGKHIYIANSVEEFVENISSLLDDKKLSEKISITGRAYVESNYSYKIVGKKMKSIYNNAIKSKIKS